MKLYFHVDRANGLKAGDIVQREPYRGESVIPALMPFANADYLRHLDKISREGLSLHGAHYLIKPGQGAVVSLVDCMLELQFEYVRHIYHKNKPSRLQSMFAFNEYERAAWFKSEKGGTGTIFEIEFSGLCLVADMNWLKVETNPDTQKHYAMSYWDGKPFSIDKHYDPKWECVIDLPVTIKREIIE